MATYAMGSKLLIGLNAIVELTEIDGLEIKADTIDVTTLDSLGYKNYIQGTKDPGEVSIKGFFNPTDSTGQIALYTALGTGALTAFTINLPSAMGVSWTFNGIVTAFKTGENMDDAVSFEGTIKVSGVPVLGLTASGGLSALVVTGAGGALSPAFGNTVYWYTYGGVSATSVTVTPTAANHTIHLYVDGAYVQDIVSAAASGSIALTISVGRKLTLVMNEAGKTSKTYEIVVVKTS